MNIITGKKKSQLDLEIESAFDELSELSKDSKEYEKIVKNLELLYKAKSLDRQGGISKDTFLIVGGNLLGIILILTYERTEIITSKAISFILKGRV